MPAVAVNKALPPSQNVVASDVVISTLGFEFTVTTSAVEVAEHPFALVTATV